ncbi:MAG: bifunctional phosphoribosyl-AMP cyclohydrolase/phosphoribosyl-ATP diphosphatase HisIE [Candidatus Marinimicrobia bacterium]|nr:bifunctional phosphoribosyl-AMP cyclohydrolase/phosphoribosyl-ATP diphosphatase HisIE [Candidatus Neomarinimicrobiota bacterium]
MELDFTKADGLIPAIIQDDNTDKVLMLGYMNKEAYRISRESGKVTFYSRSRRKLWTKGETSGNFLRIRHIREDCDADTLLIRAVPEGPVCHTGKDTCFGDENPAYTRFMEKLEKIIADRKDNPAPGSYTTQLFKKGTPKIARKVGEEATEVIIEAMDDNQGLLKEELADLFYHVLVLMADKDISMDDINYVSQQTP